ncbi:uncharacterized protein LOC117789651 [Drosophila innubila]|uniref:uncharacterized protein LOC117789651 n=1 Tax=Drosophila innubila TaxID=198719 RepID=UPI00148C462E|nr:uncharacterized protein LOC117789651 [Drosophila innubila]
MSPTITVATWLILILSVQANVIFHFSLDFNVKHPANFSEPINQTIIVENNQVSMQDNELRSSTNAPNTDPATQTWSEERLYNEAAVRLLLSTKRSVQQLNTELAPLVGRSDDLAARLKKTMKYVNQVDSSLEDGNFAHHVELLRQYLTLVDNLRSPSKAGGVRTLEFVLLKLALEKFGVLANRQEVDAYLKRADLAWTRYKSTQVVISDS